MAHSIDKHSPIPYYLQLAALLRADVAQRLASGASALPSEHALLKQYHVSRATVRNALDVLERQGLIYRRRGKGAFAAVRRVESELTALVSTSEEMRRRGWNLTTRVLELVTCVPPPEIARALELARGATAYRLVRLRLVDGKPLSLQTAYLPASLYPNLEAHDLEKSLYRLSEEVYNLRYHTAREVVRARGATRREAKLLKLRPGAPVLYCERVTFSADGRAMEYLEAVWRGDRYDFTANLTRPDARVLPQG